MKMDAKEEQMNIYGGLKISHGLKRNPSSLGNNVQIISIRSNDKRQIQSSCTSKVTINGASDLLKNGASDLSAVQEGRLTLAQSISGCLDNLLVRHMPVANQANSLRRSQSAFVTHKFQVSQLKEHCKSLEGELDGVKSEIVKMIQEKQGCDEENNLLQEYKIACKKLVEEKEYWKEENGQLKQENWMLLTQLGHLRNIEEPRKNGTKCDKHEYYDKLERKKVEQKEEERYSPDGQEVQKEIVDGEEIKDHIRLLEDSLYLLRGEMVSLETNWKMNLAEEKASWELSLKTMEDKFSMSQEEEEKKDDIELRAKLEALEEESFRECESQDSSLILKKLVKEIVRLQNLRFQLQQECDSLYLKKERLIDHIQLEREILKMEKQGL